MMFLLLSNPQLYSLSYCSIAMFSDFKATIIGQSNTICNKRSHLYLSRFKWTEGTTTILQWFPGEVEMHWAIQGYCVAAPHSCHVVLDMAPPAEDCLASSIWGPYCLMGPQHYRPSTGSFPEGSWAMLNEPWVPCGIERAAILAEG